MSFDEKVQIVENPVSQELVTKLVAQMINLEKEVRHIKAEMKALKSIRKQPRPEIKSLLKHQVYFIAPVDISSALVRVSTGLKSAIESGYVSGTSKCVVSIVGEDKESWKAIRLEFHVEKPISYKSHMRDVIA